MGPSNQSIEAKSPSYSANGHYHEGPDRLLSLVDPVGAAGLQLEVRIIFELHVKSVHARSGRLRVEAEQVKIRHVVRDGDEALLQLFGVAEVGEFASSELRDRFGGVGAESIAGGDEGHGGEAHRRSQLTDAVEHLLAVVAIVFGVGSVATEAAVRWAGFALIELGPFMPDSGVCAREGEAVHGGVGVADETQRFFECGVAVLIESFAEEKNGVAVIWRLLPQLRDSEGNSIEDGGAVVSGLEIVELSGG